MPADKNSTYRSSIAPWMYGVELAFYVPCLGTPLWLTYTLIILFTETDLFQLYTCIMNFKSYAFFFWGLIPIFTDWFDFYWSFTSGETLKQFLRSHQNDTADNWKDFFRRPELEFNELEIDELRSGLMVYGGPSTNMLDRMQDRAFLLNCALCWVVFARYKWLRSQYFLGRREPPTYTGDNDCGDREQTLFVAWDVGAITSIILIFSLDLTYRIRELSGVSAYFVSIYETFTMQPESREDMLRMDLWFSALTTWIGLSSLPFLILKCPGLGEMLHQMRATGYNEAGEVKLQLDLPQMKAKQIKLAERGQLCETEAALLDHRPSGARRSRRIV